MWKRQQQKGRAVAAAGRPADLADKAERSSWRQGKWGHGGAGTESAGGDRVPAKVTQADPQQTAGAVKRKSKRNGAGSATAQADHSAAKLVIKPSRVNFNSKAEDEHAKSAKQNRRLPAGHAAGPSDLMTYHANATPISPPARPGHAKDASSQPRRARAPRKLSKEIDGESQKHASLATPHADKHSQQASAYQTQSQPAGASALRELGQLSHDDRRQPDPSLLGSPVTAGRVGAQAKRPLDSASEARQDKLRWNTRQTANAQRQEDTFEQIIAHNIAGRGHHEPAGRRNTKVLHSLNSPEQRAADWFSAGAVADDHAKKLLGGNTLGVSDDGLQGDSNTRLMRILDGSRNQPSHPRQLDQGQGEEGSNQGVLMGMSWNSNLMSQDGKLQMLRLVSPAACNISGRNIDELPQLDSRQLSEGEENVLATQRYTESSQHEEGEHRAFFNQTSDQVAAVEALECEGQLAVPYSERRSYHYPPSTNNPSPRPVPSKISSCQVSESDRHPGSGDGPASLSRIMAGASQSENLTDDADNQELLEQTVPGSQSNNRAEEYDILSNSRRALSGLGSVGNLTGLGHRGELGRSYSRMQQQMDQKRVQSASIKKVPGQADAPQSKVGNAQESQVDMQSPKTGDAEQDVLSHKETRNAGLKVGKTREATRNSLVLKMSSIFGSKNDASAQRAAADAGNEDNQSKMVKAYYQKAGQAEHTGHKPKVGGQSTQIKDNARKDSQAGKQSKGKLRVSPEPIDPSAQSVCLKSFTHNNGGRGGTALRDAREALRDLDGGKNLVKTQKNINFKSIFKMNNSSGAYNSQQSPTDHDNRQGSRLARVPQRSQGDGARAKEGMGPGGSGRIYSMLSDSKYPNPLANDKLNNSTVVGSGQANFSKRSSINAVKEMSLGRTPGSQSRAGPGTDFGPTNPGKKRYQMDQKSTQTQLVIAKKDLKFITVNMLNMKLQIVDFSDNKLVALPDEICELSQLQQLKLDRNALQKLPGNIGLLRNLQVLSVTRNDLAELPSSLQNCRQLKELLVSDNKLEQLPPSLFNFMGQLESLHLHQNRLFQIPSSISCLASLNSVTLEWFLYLEPAQQISQAGQAGAVAIGMLKSFCSEEIKVLDLQGGQSKDQRTFTEFVVHFHVCLVLKRQGLTQQELIDGVNGLKFTSKRRCIAQTLCSNKHPHLFEEIINTKSNSAISRLVNRNYDLNVTDTHDQAPLLAALRQTSAEYPRILLSSPNLLRLDLNQQSLKHGYPLHMAILSHKFEIALQMLTLKDQIDPNVLNTVGANVAHLLFVKYDKDAVTAFKILKQCLEVGVDLNLVDRMAAAPIHLALGKKQHQALRDMALLNKQHGRRVFDFNIRDKRGLTPLHHAVEKQDHEMFLALIRDEWVDPLAYDTEEFAKARRCSVIFSAFHHILYNREKLPMRRLHCSDHCLLKSAAKKQRGNDGASSDTLAQRKASQTSHWDSQSHQSKHSSVSKARTPNDAGQADEPSLNFMSINQIKQSEGATAGDQQPRWQIHHPNSSRKAVPRQEEIDDIALFQENSKNFVTHQLFNFRAKRKIEKEQAKIRAEQAREKELSVFQKKMDEDAVAQENPYDVRGRAAHALDHQGKGVMRSLSRISHLSYHSDAVASKKAHQSGAKGSNNNTQQMHQSRKLDGEAYRSGSHYFKSEARRPPNDDVDLARPHQRQKSTVQAEPKGKTATGDPISMEGHHPSRLGSQAPRKGPATSFLSEQQQQIRNRKLLSRKQKSNSFDCDLQSQINNEYKTGEIVDKMSRLHESSRIESALSNNEYAEAQLGRRQPNEQWQNDSMETLMKKARNELKNQNNNVARGKSTSKGAKKGGLSFMSPFNYQRSMLQERKYGDALPREQIKNHSFNIKQQATRPKTSFIDSYYNLSNSKASQQTPVDFKKSAGHKVQPKIFGPKPEGATQAKSLKKTHPKRANNLSGQNIDDVEVQVEPLKAKRDQSQQSRTEGPLVLGGGQKPYMAAEQRASSPRLHEDERRDEDQPDGSSEENANCKSSKGDYKFEQGRIFISNLNINFNNVFINVKDVSIPSTPTSRTANKNDYATVPMDFSNAKGQHHKNIPCIRNILAQDGSSSMHHQKSKDIRSDIEMLVKSNVQSLRGSSQLRHSRQPMGPGGTPADASKNSDKLSTRSRATKASMQKMKKILQK